MSKADGLKKLLEKVQSKVAAVGSKTTELRKDVNQMDKEVQELRSKENNYKLEIKSLESTILDQKAYNWRES